MPLIYLLKNSLILSKDWNLNGFYVEAMPFWLFEERIKIINDINDEENNKSNNDSDSNSNFNPNQMMNNMNNMMNNFKPPSL